MNLTHENKAFIDSLSYRSLLYNWRFSPMGEPMFQGETGEYYSKRMRELRNQPGGDELHISTSKSLGW
jgi:hypothetical protein